MDGVQQNDGKQNPLLTMWHSHQMEICNIKTRTKKDRHHCGSTTYKLYIDRTYTNISDANIYAFIYRLLHENLSSVMGTGFRTSKLRANTKQDNIQTAGMFVACLDCKFEFI